MINYYEILGVASTATQEEIKTAYREKSKVYHPDASSGVTEEVKKVLEDKFKELNEAYEVLKNPEKRKKYDAEFIMAQKADLIQKISEFAEAEKFLQALEVAKKLYHLLPEDEQCCDIYAGILCDVAVETAEKGDANKAREYLKTALKVVKSEDIKKQIESDLELLKSHAGTTDTKDESEPMSDDNSDLKMTTERAIKLLKGGEAGIKAWNLFREIEDYMPSLEGVDLGGINLRGANLSDVNLKGAKLAGATLENVNFIKANLKNANLSGVSAVDVQFTNANLENVNLSGSALYGAQFIKANLSKANLSKLKGYRVYYQQYSSSTFQWGYDLVNNVHSIKSETSINFQGSNLSDAKAHEAVLPLCNLESANLTRTNFSNVKLSKANLKNTTITDTNFIGADLQNADLTGAKHYFFAIVDGTTQTNGTKGIESK